MARSAKPSPTKKPPTAIRPVLLAAGLGTYWFAVHLDGGGEADAPMWGYVTATGMQLLADVVGAWIVIAGAQLAIGLGKVGVSYARSLWVGGNQ